MARDTVTTTACDDRETNETSTNMRRRVDIFMAGEGDGNSDLSIYPNPPAWNKPLVIDRRR